MRIQLPPVGGWVGCVPLRYASYLLGLQPLRGEESGRLAGVELRLRAIEVVMRGWHSEQPFLPQRVRLQQRLRRHQELRHAVLVARQVREALPENFPWLFAFVML
jgi:hypothetical protein